MSKLVYYFGSGKADGKMEMKALLGGKGANLAEMVNIGIPVPPGFTITTEVCQMFQEKQEIPEVVYPAMKENLARVEKEIGHKFGDAENPLLFSVRSGAAASMPGMMDTVLNLGLNSTIVDAWVKRDPSHSRFVYDSYRRFITMYADIVMQVGREDFEAEMEEMKKIHNTEFDSDLSSDDLKELVAKFLALYQKKTGEPFPQDPWEQLYAAVRAVFRSWGNPRAEMYRRLNNITGLLGTAVNVQAMVFGNANDRSATGVAFSRSPSSGLNFFYGEFLINAQGEDVVAGIRTPQHISKERSMIWASGHGVSEEDRLSRYPSMEEFLPEAYKELCEIRAKLEQHYRDMMDIEFTVEDGRLWMLQCRVGKRTIQSALHIAIDMKNEGLISQDEAILRIDPYMVDHLLHPTINPDIAKKAKQVGKALAASPGAAVGQVVFDAESAVAWAERGEKVIMVRLETSPEDLAGMHAAEGFLTARGGMTSHAAVVARGMGKCCVCGCGDIEFGEDGKSFVLGGVTFKEGDFLTLDGSKGIVYAGAMELQAAGVHGDFEIFVEWCKQAKRMSVRANADTPHDAKIAKDFGAEGVGLCRTEHMFFEGARIEAFREMILAETLEGRQKALAKLLPIQRADFAGILRSMDGRPVTIRLLDPPLHEFVPP
ncbi:pyruvate,orthophosphate dikinase [Angomonas deanei]|uniref:pyruvate, phosphate dikinase n=1 Tax=Angomonas deanei TaxID=59799 RepID=A0A7G2CU77_9TRYP|nr:pyruvate,orthophosphate dikinase [Angomonas deanei]CAD2222767.1 Pyruvate phosphate dikinase, PEP/pyruvate binding domain/PEP-utilising enzyme, mobile domain/PEP-utilising enzyme, TIM barrel domain containing protein, putative [Angomonas deanei]|eukprot:EPY31309.1 pyruvate,orthophosphate dikinase [Angomonas deanei]